MRYVLLSAAALCAMTAGAAQAQPEMTGDTGRAECRQAFQLATAQFQSGARRLIAPLRTPADFPARVVIGIASVEISQGDALIFDKAVFEKISHQGSDNNLRALYWQIAPRDGKRLVVAENAFNYEGDNYTYYVVDQGAQPQSLMFDPGMAEARGVNPVRSQVWRPLALLQDTQSGQLWAIDQDPDAPWNTSWNVYAMDKGSLAVRCRIAFMPEVELSKAVTLLPQPAQRFAALLGDVLGPGKNEGTFQQTWRTSVYADLAWRNAIARPWALLPNDENGVRVPYNSRAQVDARLKAWAARSPKSRAAYAALMQQYPRAQAVLENHYRKAFFLPGAAAKAMAAYATDFLYRSYFVFPGGAAQLSQNPWPASKPDLPQATLPR